MPQHVTFVENRSLLEIKIIEKLETIAIAQVNIKMQHIVYAIQQLMYQSKFM